MAPLAPGLFSTTMFCPSEAFALSASCRATKSVVPPAAKATTSRIGRFGESCAAAPPAARTAASAAAINELLRTVFSARFGGSLLRRRRRCPQGARRGHRVAGRARLGRQARAKLAPSPRQVRALTPRGVATTFRAHSPRQPAHVQYRSSGSHAARALVPGPDPGVAPFLGGSGV